EVGVAADVELARPLEPHAPLHEQAREHAVHYGGADLRLRVVADDGQPALLEAPSPVGLPRDEDRDAVDEPTTGVEDLLDVPLGRHLAADGKEVDDDLRARVAEDSHDVGR